MHMTAAELIASRERLGLSVDALAAEVGVTPHIVEAWERGSLAIPKDTALQLRWRTALEERQALVAASGLPECPTAIALEEKMDATEGDTYMKALERFGAHAESCDVCRARREYADRHGPAVPDLPLPTWMRVVGRIDGLFNRLPAGIRPPDGDRGTGRRMGLWGATIFSVLAIVIVGASALRGRAASMGSPSEVAVQLAAAIAAYFVGFYCAGAIYDALRPIGHRFVGYVLRWGLGGATVYGAIGLALQITEDEPTPWSTTAQIVLLLGAIWGVIGAGVWVKHKRSGKLPEPGS